MSVDNAWEACETLRVIGHFNLNKSVYESQINCVNELEFFIQQSHKYKTALETIVCDREVLGAEGIYEVALNALKGQNDE